VVDMAEKILYLLDRPEERVKMGEFGKRRVEKELEWKYEEPKLLAAYTTLFED
jgi:spore maturation protein CgeB